MKYRTLGKSDLRVSVIGLGTHQFSGEWGKIFTQKEVDELIFRAKELGINLIDTAACYGPHLSERMIGHAIQNNRDDWIIATKFGQIYDSKSKTTKKDFTLKNVKRQLNRSLKSLNTDFLDIYQFHSGNNDDFNNEELWSYMNKQVDKGTIGCIGVSMAHEMVENDDPHQLDRLEDIGASVCQIVYNRLSSKAEKSFLPSLSKNNIGVIGRIPLAKGFLSGKYSPGHNFTDSHRSSFNKNFNDELLQRALAIKSSEVPSGINMSSWALAWCLRNESVSSIIPGSKNLNQLKSNALSSKLLK